MAKERRRVYSSPSGSTTEVASTTLVDESKEKETYPPPQTVPAPAPKPKPKAVAPAHQNRWLVKASIKYMSVDGRERYVMTGGIVDDLSERDVTMLFARGAIAPHME